MRILRGAVAVLTLATAVAVAGRALMAPPMRSRLAQTEFPDGDGTPLTEEDLAGLPAPFQRYLRSSGHVDRAVAGHVVVHFSDVDFRTGPGQPVMKVGYVLYDDATAPQRAAWIGGVMRRLPFEAYDYLLDGAGGMEARLAGILPLFHHRNLRDAQMLTWLAESPMFPNPAGWRHVTFTALDDHRVRAEIGGVGGVLTFNDEDEYVSFHTEDRRNDAAGRPLPWTAEFGEYAEIDGHRIPTTMKAVWHYPEGDLVYFDGTVDSVHRY